MSSHFCMGYLKICLSFCFSYRWSLTFLAKKKIQNENRTEKNHTHFQDNTTQISRKYAKKMIFRRNLLTSLIAANSHRFVKHYCHTVSPVSSSNNAAVRVRFAPSPTGKQYFRQVMKFFLPKRKFPSPLSQDTCT